jgi:hypothetical protein
MRAPLANLLRLHGPGYRYSAGLRFDSPPGVLTTYNTYRAVAIAS